MSVVVAANVGLAALFILIGAHYYYNYYYYYYLIIITLCLYVGSLISFHALLPSLASQLSLSLCVSQCVSPGHPLLRPLAQGC